MQWNGVSNAFVVTTTEGQNRLGLRELCERYVNDQWFAAHASGELAAEALLEQLRHAVAIELGSLSD